MLHIGIFLGLGVVGLTVDPYHQFVLSRIVLYAIVCLGLNILIGYAGQLAFAQAAMFGIGAYATGLLQVKLGLPYLPSAVLAVVLTTLIGSVLTLPALRLSGLYLALSTLSFALAVQWVLLNWTDLTYGAGGFRAPRLDLGFGFDSGTSIFVVTVIVALVMTLAADNLLRSKFGRQFVAIRENPIAAASLGTNVFRVKLLAFAVSAFYAGVAGALFVPMLGFVAPESFDLNQMIMQQIMIVVGGLASVVGTLVGVFVVSIGFELLRDTPALVEIIFGTALIACVLWRPEGVVSLLRNYAIFREAYLPRRATNSPKFARPAVPALRKE